MNILLGEYIKHNTILYCMISLQVFTFRRYSPLCGFLLTPAEGFDLFTRLFFPLLAKNGIYGVFAYFEPLMVFSNNLSNW